MLYLILGVGAALENIVPPIPADTFVLFGAFLAAKGEASAWLIFMATWLSNIATAVGVYLLAFRHQDWFTNSPIARWILQPEQANQIHRFYRRYGIPALAFSRFLPAFRAVVPVFAGMSRMPWYRVIPPIAFASGLWYGMLVVLGTVAGHNWAFVVGVFGQISRTLVWITLPLVILVFIWWVRTRRDRG